jgi:hypothetical protein
MPDRREVFETIDCSVAGCRSCTDIFDDSTLDSGFRDQFVRSCRSLQALHPSQVKDEELSLLPIRVCGYSVQGDRWHPLNIERLKQIKAIPNALEHLVLPAEQKRILMSLVQAQSRANQSRNFHGDIDIVAGKLRGWTVLLHGPPGTGKTTTAEALAATLQRPLLSVRNTTLSSSARDFEADLLAWFRLAEHWGCILLVADADSFVSQRQKGDREGTGITSGKFKPNSCLSNQS